MKSIEMHATHLAGKDEWGSSKRAHNRARSLCHLVNAPFPCSSSKPKSRAICSSLSLSPSTSNLSRIARVAWVSLCLLYVLQQHGSTCNPELRFQIRLGFPVIHSRLIGKLVSWMDGWMGIVSNIVYNCWVNTSGIYFTNRTEIVGKIRTLISSPRGDSGFKAKAVAA